MAIHRLPRNILRDIIEYALCDDYASASESVALGLVDRVFYEEVSDAIYERDVMDVLGKNTLGTWSLHPTGPGLHKYIRGFLLRPATTSDVLNNIRKSLRDGVLISSVILDPESRTKRSKSVTTTQISKARTSTEDLSSKTPETLITTTAEDTSEDSDETLPEHAILPVCQAYVDLLGDESAFRSLDPSFERDPAQFEDLDGKTGHFWAFLAASMEGEPDVVTRAAKVCTDQFGSEDDSVKLKTHFAAGLLLMAKFGNVEAAKALLAHPEMRVNLRLQNIRFVGTNAFERAIQSNQCDMVELLLSHGWNLTTVPIDYVKALRTTIIDLKPCPLREKLLKILLEGDCQQWRSDAIVTGMYNELCKNGDLEACKKVSSLLKEPVADKTEFRWVWDFKQNATNDVITGAPANNNNNNDEEDMDEMDFTAPEMKTMLNHAVAGKHPKMIPWIWENKDHFPEPMAYTFDRRTQIHCLETSIKKSEQETFLMLLKHNPDDLNIDKSRLFLLAVILGNLEVMTTLFPDIDLTQELNESSDFWSWYDHTELCTTIPSMEDWRQPHSFLFNTYPRRNCTLGTYALLGAVKALQVPAATFLLSKKCQIGTRLISITPSFIERHHARIFIPGADFNPTRTLCLTRRSWWRLARCKGTALEAAKAKILTGIVVPSATMDSTDPGEEAMQARLKDMQALMRKHKMPLVYAPPRDS